MAPRSIAPGVAPPIEPMLARVAAETYDQLEVTAPFELERVLQAAGEP